MKRADTQLLVRRIFVQTNLPYRALRIDLATPEFRTAVRAGLYPAGAMQRLGVKQLVELAESLAVEGLVFRADGRSLAQLPLPAALRRARSRLPGWIALHTRGPDPLALEMMLAERLLDFVDMELSWMESHATSRQPRIQLAPSIRRSQAILCRSNRSCILRFVSRPAGGVFDKVSAAFDSFVRESRDPVAVRMLEADESTASAADTELLVFVACRPAWTLDGAIGEWLNVQVGARAQEVAGERANRAAMTDNNPQWIRRLRFQE